MSNYLNNQLLHKHFKLGVILKYTHLFNFKFKDWKEQANAIGPYALLKPQNLHLFV